MEGPATTLEQDGWSVVELGDCGVLYCGQSPSVAEVNTDGRGCPYFTGPEQWDGSKLHVDKWTEHPKRLVPDGCIFITVKGAGVGKLFPGVAGAIGRDIYAFRVHPALDVEFILYGLRYTIDTVVGHAKGDIPGLSKNQILDHRIALPSTAHQRRIVAKIEELFSELDKGVESLATARQQLKAYRQSVLKQAFDGKLTENWRKENGSKLRDARSIRSEVLEARQRRWNESVDFRRAHYGEVQPYDKEDVPAAPETWALVSMDELCHHITSGSRGWSQYYDRGTSVFIMAQNVRPGRYDASSTQIVDPPADNAETHRTRVRNLDLLVTIVGANTGDVCLFPFESDSHYVCQSVALMRLAKQEYAKYLDYYFQARHGGQRQYRRYIYGAGRPHLSFEQLRQTVVPLPTTLEASEIVRRIEQALSRCDHQCSMIDAEIVRAQALRQSILKKAFSGQLIAQDRSDEPASVLLERIRAEQAADNGNKRPKNKNGKKEAA